MILCKYRDIFGKPKKGFHKNRFLGFALYDIIGTIIIALIISGLFATNFWITLFTLLFVAQILHYLFCVNTTFINHILGIKL